MQDQSFHSGEIDAQQRWSTAGMWDEARRERLLWDHIPSQLHARLEGAVFFFLATSSPDGRCDCSFKGGGPGLIRILDARKFAFPDFDGNGAFMSLGNILLNPHVGCLFIDFNDGGRLRVNGRAEIVEQGPVLAYFPGATRVVLVNIEQVVPNCP
ncbi:MAG: pyridoxamine 5'-phosphate oxidase family protein, partial [Gammaproteobacteria bacterium]|nr:pyridoxamine 5'-phosphate oxidase family protein [Gammaproteobacteria bacterium]